MAVKYFKPPNKHIEPDDLVIVFHNNQISIGSLKHQSINPLMYIVHLSVTKLFSMFLIQYFLRSNTTIGITAVNIKQLEKMTFLKQNGQIELALLSCVDELFAFIGLPFF